MANYSTTSPYYTTVSNNLYLETLNIRSVPAEGDDFLYTIENQYQYRPDLLAYDLYGDPSLWWVFVQRNMEVIKDPIYDFEPGVKIYIPKDSNLRKFLGV
jgi:alpha-L-fucosidase